MAGVVLETLSWKKLIPLGIILLIQPLIFFIIGAKVAPAPTNVISMLATKCLDRSANKDPLKWFTPRGKNSCEILDSLDPNDARIISEGITEKQVVFSIWKPWPRAGEQLKMHRLFQFLLGILQLDIEYNPEIPLEKGAKIQLDIRLGGRNEGEDEWTLIAESNEDRVLECDHSAKMDVGDFYDCEVMQLFELGSTYYHYYLINLRLPSNYLKGINMNIGKIRDIYVHGIHQNGGFSIVWYSIKSIMFPMVLVGLIWFWRRISLLARPPNLLERTLMALGITLTILNCPIEWLQLSFNFSFMLLLNDIRQGAFYAMLLCFWIIFAGEHIMDQTERNRLSLYWKHLSAIIFGCFCMLLFEVCERGIQLQNPFFSIWVTKTGTNLALALIILASVSACCYFFFLCWMIFCVFRNINAKRSSLPSMSNLRKQFYMGLIYRFKFLMILTLFCAALTVIFFIISQLSEGRWKWGDEEIHLNYTGGFFASVYSLWNVYVFGLLCMYAPSHKKYADVSNDEDTSQEETVQLNQLSSSAVASESSALQAFAQKAAQD